VGAFGGRADLMTQVAPLGPVYQAGTLSGHPLAMAAGLATLKELKSQPPYDALARRTEQFAQGIRGAAKTHGVAVRVNAAGSMFTVFFTDMEVQSYFDALQCDTKRYASFFHELLRRGVYLPPSQFEAAFISTAHTEEVLQAALQAVEESFKCISMTKSQ
jgi:glutamate-1-semialdehyde 2,1-aminomutase